MILVDDVSLCAAEIGLLIERAAVAIEDGRVIAILRGEDERRAACARADDVVAGNGMIMIPGPIHPHTQSYGNVLLGTAHNLSLYPLALYNVSYGLSLNYI